MFAFCILDRTRHRLFLARDRFGEKPLYYCRHSHGFVFASELSALALHDAVRRTTSRRALQKYFAYGYIPAPLALLEGWRQVPRVEVIYISISNRQARHKVVLAISNRVDSSLKNVRA